MGRWVVVLAAVQLVSSLGCAMCANPHDCKYAAYGGRRQRADRVHGRVASVFDPAAEVSAGEAPAAASSWEPTPFGSQEEGEETWEAEPVEPVEPADTEGPSAPPAVEAEELPELPDLDGEGELTPPEALLPSSGLR